MIQVLTVSILLLITYHEEFYSFVYEKLRFDTF